MNHDGSPFIMPEHIIDGVAGEVFSRLLMASRALVPAELSAQTGLDPRIVSLACTALADRGFITPAYIGETGGPLEATPFVVDVDSYSVIGVKVAPGGLIGVVTNLAAESSESSFAALPADNPDVVVGAVADIVSDLRQRTTERGHGSRQIIGIGVEVGGHVDSERGEVRLSPHLNWRSTVELGNRVFEATGLPVIVENDVNALAIHQHMFGSGRGTDWFGVVLVADGLGCGLVLGGQLARGISGSAGELGHIAIGSRYRRACHCGNLGCLETISSAAAMLRTVNRRLGSLHDLTTVVAMADGGDTIVLEVFSEAGEALGRAVAILLNLLNMERILIAVPEPLGHRNRGARVVFEQSMREAISKRTFSTTDKDCEILFEHIPDVYGAEGAAAVVIQRFASEPLQWRP